MESKQYLLNALRKLHLLNISNSVGLYFNNFKSRSTNRAFQALHPDEPFPPAEMIYEVFGRTSYERYFLSGQRAAYNLITLLRKYSKFEETNILEWGCGVARILRHVAKLTVKQNNRIFGTDLDPEMIRWNSENFDDIAFSINKLLPPTEFKDNFFDIIYCTSVFTHLPEDVQHLWVKEMGRILKKGGIFLFTTHGDFYANEKLSKADLRKYQEGHFILRAKVANGSKLMTTFQSPVYVREKMLNGFELLEHNTDTTLQIAGSQDIWIVKKS